MLRLVSHGLIRRPLGQGKSQSARRVPTHHIQPAPTGRYFAQTISVKPDPLDDKTGDAQIHALVKILTTTAREPLTSAQVVQLRQFVNYARHQDLVIYRKPVGQFQRIVKFSLLAQLLFWLNLAHLAYLNMREQNPETGKLEMAPQLKRAGMSAAMLTVALFVSGLMLTYASAYVYSVTLLKGGRAILFETATLFKPGRYQMPLTSVFGSARLGTNPAAAEGTNFYYLRSTGRKIGFQLDRRAEFLEPGTWDALFYRNLPRR
ncbi:hypothetical protein IWQ61_004385 [Dispira simplex]|nr:hypothetical protein IWQ61_004385 [Dispira simplex]